jgi:glycosyltransferase involved in cell wall biosynthesis
VATLLNSLRKEYLKNMLDITTIILTYNEELHIKRCLDIISPVAKDVFVIDCFSKDRTVEIAQSYANVHVLQHEWPVTKYAGQFNWALENVPITTKWVMRLDADEYPLPDLIEEMQAKIPSIGDDITGIVLKRRHIFMGKWVKRGIYPIKLIRIFRYGKAMCEQRFMDEHIQLLEGQYVEFEHDFCDHSLISISEYCKKHINYAHREAAEILNEKYKLIESRAENVTHLGKQAERKHKTKSKYNRSPLFWRSFAYFIYRYFLRGGFLDGKEGFLFAFIQGWWYRTLVDIKILEVRRWLKDNHLDADSHEGRQALKKYVKDNWGITTN